MDRDTAVAIVGELIPIVAIVLGIGIAMLSVYLDFRKKRELVQAYHAERMAAIEKGIEIPPLPEELLHSGMKRDATPTRHRRNGLILLLLGIAISGAMLAQHNPGAWWGAVPAAIGLALLISARLEARELARGGAAANRGSAPAPRPGSGRPESWS